MVKTLYFLISLLLAVVSPLAAESRLLFRISVENTSTHVQAKAVGDFADRISRLMGDKIKVDFYDSAKLYRDSDVVEALARGTIEMAVPGTWQLDKYIPEVGFLLLPDFFGSDATANYEFLKSRQGIELVNRIENYLDVVVPGEWMDLGPAHIFTTSKKIKNFNDFDGLQIRVAGGIANKMRVEAFGADGIIIPWPDLIPRISDGTVDGILTTFETVRSASLWKYGIKYVFMDSEYFPQYVPLVSARFWKMLSNEQQHLFIETWNDIVVQQRIDARLSQISARQLLEAEGITITEPSTATLEAGRNILNGIRGQIIMNLGIEQDFIEIGNTEN